MFDLTTIQLMNMAAEAISQLSSGEPQRMATAPFLVRMTSEIQAKRCAEIPGARLADYLDFSLQKPFTLAGHDQTWRLSQNSP